jgi:SsrA-binding protein
MGEKIVVINKKARHRYQFLEKFEAGLALKGSEVKSLRAGHVQMADAYATVNNGELFLINCHIAPYIPANQFNHEPMRSRKLLFHRREIEILIGKIQQKRLTLVPTKIYFKNGRAKVELALAQGKQMKDQREDLKKKAQQREMEQALKRQSK